MNKYNVRRKDRKNKVSSKYSANLGKIFAKHVKCEFEDRDVEATMKTMVKQPYEHHVPTMTGGTGYDNVYNFYKNDFIGKMPKDVRITPISRTAGKNQIVDELILSFTHSREINLCYLEYLLRGSM
jgi:carboxymethylenebutenolidase